MNKIFVSSNFDIKKKTINNFLNYLNIDGDIEFFELNDIYIPPQFINSGEDFVRNKINNINNDTFEYILCVYNFLKIENKKIINYFFISFKDNNDSTYEIYGSEIEIDYKILKDYPNFINVIDDIYESYLNTSKKYIYDGCDATLGFLINKYYPNISESNWSKIIFKKDNNSRVNKLLNKMSRIIK